MKDKRRKREQKKICYLSQREKMSDRKSEKKTLSAVSFPQFQTHQYFTGDIYLLHMIGESCRSDYSVLTPTDTLEKMTFYTVPHSNHTVVQSHSHIITDTVTSASAKACHMQSIQYWNRLTPPSRLKVNSFGNCFEGRCLRNLEEWSHNVISCGHWLKAYIK